MPLVAMIMQNLPPATVPASPPIVINYGPAVGGVPEQEHDPRFDEPQIEIKVSTAVVYSAERTAEITTRLQDAPVRSRESQAELTAVEKTAPVAAQVTTKEKK